jgi:inosose dehydratase
VTTVRHYAERLDYLHFKDIDTKVFDQVLGERITFFAACARGVMCPIGRGVIDYRQLRELLGELRYQGFITVEQERDPRNAGSSFADVSASRTYLAHAGF